MINYRENFKHSLDYIEKLISTPNQVKDIAISGLKDIDFSSLKNTENVKINNLIKCIDNISSSTLKREYSIIYNQSCILAVSALESTIEKYFINNINSNWKKLNLCDEKIKLSLKELSEYEFNIKPNLGEIILNKSDFINFQDLQSIIRTFKEYFDKNINLNIETKNDVILYQQIRHVLAHKNEIIDEEFLKKTKELKHGYTKSDKVKLDNKDWENIKVSFYNLIDSIVKTEDIK